MTKISFFDLELDEVVVGFDDNVTTNNIITLSHGCFPVTDYNKKQCVVPANIILHQYTLPRQNLNSTHVEEISKFIDEHSYTKKFEKTFYTVDDDIDVKTQRIIERVIEPGQKTTNLEITFDQSVKNYKMGISCNEHPPVQLGTVTLPIVCTLEEMMNKISSTYADSFIHFYQLSCRNGNIKSLDLESQAYEEDLMMEYMFEEPSNSDYWVFNNEHEAHVFKKKAYAIKN